MSPRGRSVPILRCLEFSPGQGVPHCLATDVHKARLPSHGVLYSYTTVHVAPPGWQVPFVIGYVDLANGLRVLAHIGVPQDYLKIGAMLQLATAAVATDDEGSPLTTYIFVAQGDRDA